MVCLHLIAEWASVAQTTVYSGGEDVSKPCVWQSGSQRMVRLEWYEAGLSA